MKLIKRFPTILIHIFKKKIEEVALLYIMPAYRSLVAYIGASTPLKCMAGTGIDFDCIVNWNLKMELFLTTP
jgi:hypothetical protein